MAIIAGIHGYFRRVEQRQWDKMQKVCTIVAGVFSSVPVGGELVQLVARDCFRNYTACPSGYSFIMSTVAWSMVITIPITLIVGAMVLEMPLERDSSVKKITEAHGG